MSDLTEQQIIDLFKDAPEGATHYDTDPDVYPWLKYHVAGSQFWHLNVWVNYNENIIGAEGVIPRPEVKPVTPIFTQEMADNGELPSVGMEYQDGVVVVDADADGMYVVQEAGVSIICALSGITPTTPPIEPIDDEAYQFTLSSGDTFKGVYRSMNKSFYNHHGDFLAFYCTNIKLLGVKS